MEKEIVSEKKSYDYLSDYYANDVADAVLLTEYPSSNNPETCFLNKERFIIHDPFPPPPLKLLKYLGPHHLMLGWGSALSVASEFAPDERLLAHWNSMLGETSLPRWKTVNQNDTYIELFPHEWLADKQHLINPEALYALHSKEALSFIAAPQPKLLPKWHIPSVAKLSHGYANTGNFFITTEQEKHRIQHTLAKTWPLGELFFSEIVENIVSDICAQFYLDKYGRTYWLGLTKQLFNADKRWCGGTFESKEQAYWEEKIAFIVQQVAYVLHDQGYFGVVGIDVLENTSNELFLIDLNPRLNGTTPFVMVSRQLAKEGYDYGAYHPSMIFPFGVDQLLAKCEQYRDAKLIVQAVFEEQNRTTCHLAIHGDTKTSYLKAFDTISKWQE